VPRTADTGCQRGHKGIGKKLIEYSAQSAEKFDCELCEKTWALYDESPKCDECIPVTLRPENVKAYQVFAQCRGQIITQGMNRVPVDISIPAVETIMAWMGVKRKHRGSVGFKVLSLARQEIKSIREKLSNQQPAEE